MVRRLLRVTTELQLDVKNGVSFLLVSLSVTLLISTLETVNITICYRHHLLKCELFIVRTHLEVTILRKEINFGRKYSRTKNPVLFSILDIPKYVIRLGWI